MSKYRLLSKSNVCILPVMDWETISRVTKKRRKSIDLMDFVNIALIVSMALAGQYCRNHHCRNGYPISTAGFPSAQEIE